MPQQTGLASRLNDINARLGGLTEREIEAVFCEVGARCIRALRHDEEPTLVDYFERYIRLLKSGEYHVPDFMPCRIITLMERVEVDQ